MSEKKSSTFTNHNFSITHCWECGARSFFFIAFHGDIVAEKCVCVCGRRHCCHRCIVEKNVYNIALFVRRFLSLCLCVRLCVYYRSLVKATEFRFDKKSSTSYGSFLFFSPCVFTILLLCWHFLNYYRTLSVQWIFHNSGGATATSSGRWYRALDGALLLIFLNVHFNNCAAFFFPLLSS